MKTQRLMGGQTTKFDRRGAERIAQTDAVELSFENPVPVTIQAILIDGSATGFRASHDCEALEPKVIVHFKRAGGSGRARVIWTHVLNQRRVSGFMLLD